MEKTEIVQGPRFKQRINPMAEKLALALSIPQEQKADGPKTLNRKTRRKIQAIRRADGRAV